VSERFLSLFGVAVLCCFPNPAAPFASSVSDTAGVLLRLLAMDRMRRAIAVCLTLALFLAVWPDCRIFQCVSLQFQLISASPSFFVCLPGRVAMYSRYSLTGHTIHFHLGLLCPQYLYFVILFLLVSRFFPNLKFIISGKVDQPFGPENNYNIKNKYLIINL